MEDYWKCRGVARIYSGGLSGLLKAITRSPQGVRGRRPPPTRTVARFHYLKRVKVLENESIFKNINIFSCLKIHFFPRKISKIGHLSQEFLSFLKKLFKILIFLEELYKPREIPDELYYLLETFIKKPKIA